MSPSRHHLSFASPRAKRVIVAATIITAAVLIAFAFKIDQYVETDPEFCLNCHVMTAAWDTWAASSHRTITCRRCHELTRLQSLHLLYRYTVGRQGQVSDHGRTPDEPCRRCHLSADRRWPQVSRTAGHSAHVLKAKIPCIRCHGAGMHGFHPSPTICRDCHQHVFVRIQGMGTLHCLSCHEYLAPDRSLKPSRASCLACHSRMGLARVSFGGTSPMQFPCGACHEPHKNANPKQSCAGCHQKAVNPAAPAAHQDCTVCHRPHYWNFGSGSQCRDCHASVPQNVAEHHIPNHVDRFCQDCHQQHRWTFPGRAVCTSCHTKMQAVPHPMPWVKGHQQPAMAERSRCATCHENRFCASCHQQVRPTSHAQPAWATTAHGPAAVRQGFRCATCHSRAYCTNCHGLAMPHPSGWVRLHSAPARNRALCARCHDKPFCDKCHGGPNMMPPDHVNNWNARHGKLALTQKARCLTCHTQRQCDVCHGLPMPHPSGWLPAGHGPSASLRPGSVCFRCHRPSYCYRTCHERPPGQ